MVAEELFVFGEEVEQLLAEFQFVREAAEEGLRGIRDYSAARLIIIT